MASLRAGGRTYAVRPFKLGELRRAAPHIDRLAARGGRFDSLEALAEAAADMIAAIAVGIPGADPQALLAETSLQELDGVRAAFEAVLAEAGLQRSQAAEGAAAGERPVAGRPDP